MEKLLHELRAIITPLTAETMENLEKIYALYGKQFHYFSEVLKVQEKLIEQALKLGNPKISEELKKEKVEIEEMAKMFREAQKTIFYISHK